MILKKENLDALKKGIA